MSIKNQSNIIQLVKSYTRNIIFIEMPEHLCPIEGLLRKDAVVYTYCYF